MPSVLFYIHFVEKENKTCDFVENQIIVTPPSFPWIITHCPPALGVLLYTLSPLSFYTPLPIITSQSLKSLLCYITNHLITGPSVHFFSLELQCFPRLHLGDIVILRKQN